MTNKINRELQGALPTIRDPILLAPQSGALRINAYRDFLPNPTTYSF